MKMGLATAFKIVLDLARQNVINVKDLPEENKKQMIAIEIIEEHSENFQDDPAHD